MLKPPWMHLTALKLDLCVNFYFIPFFNTNKSHNNVSLSYYTFSVTLSRPQCNQQLLYLSQVQFCLDS